MAYYIKVKEYIRDDVHNGFFDMGYFEGLEYWLENILHICVQTVSEKELAKHYKYKGLAEKKIKEIYELTKDLSYYHPYEDNIYKYQFEIVEEE